MSRDDSTDLQKEVTHLRLRLHHAESQVEQLRAAFSLNTTIVREFEGMLQRMTEERDGLRKELQDTREDLDRVNETLAKLFKTRL